MLVKTNGRYETSLIKNFDKSGFVDTLFEILQQSTYQSELPGPF